MNTKDEFHNALCKALTTINMLHEAGAAQSMYIKGC